MNPLRRLRHRAAVATLGATVALLAVALVPSPARATQTCDAGTARGGSGETHCTPDLAIKKTGPSQVMFGETATYSVIVSNVGQMRVARTSVHVTDPAASAVELAFHRVVAGDTDTWLEPGEAWEYRLADGRAITVPASSCQPITNSAAVAPLRGERKLRNNSSSVLTKVLCRPDLAIAKTADKATYRPGETIVYTITVTNSGQISIPIDAIVVADPSLPSLALVGEPPAVVMPGAAVTYRGTRTATLHDCGIIANTATVALGPNEPRTHQPWTELTLANNTAAAAVEVICQPGVAITKVADHTTYEPGQPITYTVVVTNTGQTTLPFGQIGVVDPTTPLTLVGTAPSSVPPGGTLTYRGTRPTSVNDCGPVVNTATVTVGSPARAVVAPLTSSATVTVTVAGNACRPAQVDATLTVAKSGPTVWRARKVFVHTITVTNMGPVTATDVVVEDPIPNGLVVAQRPAGATYVDGTVRWQLGDLGPGESRVVRVSLKTTFRVAARRCNIAQADATNAAPVTSRLCTRFVAVAGQQFDGVTG